MGFLRILTESEEGEEEGLLHLLLPGVWAWAMLVFLAVRVLYQSVPLPLGIRREIWAFSAGGKGKMEQCAWGIACMWAEGDNYSQMFGANSSSYPHFRSLFSNFIVV